MLFGGLCFHLWAFAVSAKAFQSTLASPNHQPHVAAENTLRLAHTSETEEFESKDQRQETAFNQRSGSLSAKKYPRSPARLRPPLSIHSPSSNISSLAHGAPRYAIECFDNHSSRLRPATAENCQVVINYIILGYPDPMLSRTFGFNDDVDIDLREDDNKKWVYENCVIFIRNHNKNRVDTFSMADVAVTADRIVDQCVTGTKYGWGGTSQVGSPSEFFYVAVGGVPLDRREG